jgi:hypothetical protein
MTRLVAVTLLVGAAGLTGCYVVSPYAYPAPPPPAPPGAPAPRPGGPVTSPPAGAIPAPPPGSAQNCQTVTVEGHSETILKPNGQRETVWIPAHQQQVCQ